MSEIRRPMGLFDDEDEDLFLEEGEETEAEEEPRRGLGRLFGRRRRKEQAQAAEEKEEELPEPEPEPEKKPKRGLGRFTTGFRRRQEEAPAEAAPAEQAPQEDLEAPSPDLLADEGMPAIDDQALFEEMLESMEESSSELEEMEEEKGFLGKLLSRFKKEQKEEEQAPEKKPRVAKGKLGFTRGQTIVLAVLVLLVLAVYGVFISIVLRSRPASPTQEAITTDDVTVLVLGGTPVDWTGNITATAGAEGTPGEATQIETPTLVVTDSTVEEGEPVLPTITPTPIPAVSTRFDLQVLSEPNNVDLRLQRGQEYLNLGAYALALTDFKHAQKLSPELAEAYLGMGRAYFHLREWEDAETALSTAISFDQDLRDAHFWLATLYYYQGRYAEAQREFDWAAEIDPDYIEAEAWLSLASYQLGDATEAMGAATRAMSLTLTLDKQVPLVYVARAWAWTIQEEPDLERAQGDLLYAQGFAPYNFYVLNALASFYRQHRPERLNEAEQLAQFAQEWAENDLQKAVALQTLGRVYMTQGRKTDARDAFNRASDLAMADGHIALAGLAEDLERTFEQ